jgi:hypothetical protein
MMRWSSGNIGREAIQQGGFAAAGAAADQDVEPGKHCDAHEVGYLLGARAVDDQIFHPVAVAAKAADAQAGAVDRKRRYDGVNTRAVGQPRVNHRRGLVDPPADARHDAVDNAHQVPIIAKAHGGLVDFAVALDPYSAVAVDQDVGDVVVLEQRFERAEAQHVTGGGFDQAFAIGFGQQQMLFVDQFVDHRVHLRQQRRVACVFELGDVDFLEQQILDPALERLETHLARVLAGRGD